MTGQFSEWKCRKFTKECILMFAVVPTNNNKHQRGIFGSLINWFWHGSRARQTLAWITLSNRVLVRHPALIRFRTYLGRSEAGGEDSMRFPTSDCIIWHKKVARVYRCLRVSSLLMMRGSLIRTRTRLHSNRLSSHPFWESSDTWKLVPITKNHSKNNNTSAYLHPLD